MSHNKHDSLKIVEGYVTVDDGVRLYYRKVGEGAKILIVPNALYLFDDFKQLAEGPDRTVIFYDMRNRGRSDSITDPEKLRRGILLDVEDLEKIRLHFNAGKIDLIGHSYLGLMVVLYTLKYPDVVHRVIQIGAAPLKFDTEYPEHLAAPDRESVPGAADLEALKKLEESGYHTSHPTEFSQKWWAVVKTTLVTNSEDAVKIGDECLDYPNEWALNQQKHFRENIVPSINQLDISIDDLKRVSHPVLTIHGTMDRGVPYGSGREWAFNLPDARLVTIEGAAHLPWIEAPELVFQSIKTFLAGTWPETAERVQSIDPKNSHA